MMISFNMDPPLLKGGFGKHLQCGVKSFPSPSVVVRERAPKDHFENGLERGLLTVLASIGLGHTFDAFLITGVECDGVLEARRGREGVDPRVLYSGGQD